MGLADFEKESRGSIQGQDEHIGGKIDSGPGPASRAKELDDSMNQQDNVLSCVGVMHHVFYGKRGIGDMLEVNCCHPKWPFAM